MDRQVSRQSGSPVDPAEYPARAARQWIPPSIPPERLASRSRRVSRQSGSPVYPAEHPARAARQWIPPSIPPERVASGSRRVSRQSGLPVDPAEHPARAARQWIPQSISPEQPAESPVKLSSIPLSIFCGWILPSIRPVSSRSGSPVFARQYPARAACQSGNSESKSLGCGGICCNSRKLVSVEGGDRSKRSNFYSPYLRGSADQKWLVSC